MKFDKAALVAPSPASYPKKFDAGASVALNPELFPMKVEYDVVTFPATATNGLAGSNVPPERSFAPLPAPSPKKFESLAAPAS